MNIQISGLFQVPLSGNTKYIDDLSVNVSPTSSNVVGINATIQTGSWQALFTSSLGNIRYLSFDSFGTSGQVSIAVSSSNGLNNIATLWAGDVAVIPWSASYTPSLWAQAYNVSQSLNSVPIQYILVQS